MSVPPSAAEEANRLIEVEGNGFRVSAYSSPLNQRIQVLSYDGDDLHEMVESLIELARDAGFGKIFLKADESHAAGFEAAGLIPEATITGYFSGRSAVVLSHFLTDERRHRPCADEEAGILERIRERPADCSVPDLPAGYGMAPVSDDDAAEIAGLYRTVFASYPFPITDEAYILTTMRQDVAYRLVRDGDGQVVAAASAEMNPGLGNAEMTDFATLPNQRGLGLAQHLLAALESDMAEREISNLYTIARARSAGMNRVFYNRGYEFTGTLVNNCHIAGQFEDMHIWCRQRR